VTAYADDITVITKPNQTSIQAIFDQYEKLTKLSGLTLNAEKTEIINAQHQNDSYAIVYNNNNFQISPLESIIICGIKFSNDENSEYEYNIRRRIAEMETQLKKWLCRDLSLNGRNIVAKTFGLSQLIYVFQCCEVREKELVDIERLYFRFLWSKTWENKAPDRIKRSMLKNSKKRGGLNCVDVKSLYQALALKNILITTANSDKYEMQNWLNDMIGFSIMTQETEEFSVYDPITKTAQIALNTITRHSRINNFGETNGEIQTKLLEQALHTDLPRFAKINNYPILRQQLARMNHIKTVNDLINNMTGEAYNLYDNTFSLLPPFLKTLKEFWNPTLRAPSQLYFLCDGKSVAAKDVQSSQLQVILKDALKKISEPETIRKYSLNQAIQTEDMFTNLYYKVKDPKLRAINFRILHGDVFSKDRMMRFNMSDDDKCERCGQIESKNHQLHDCKYAKDMWAHYNCTMRQIGLANVEVNSIEQAIMPQKEGNYFSETLKALVLKANIQIERPKHNIPVVLNTLFYKQARLENLVASRKYSVDKTRKKKYSLWPKLLQYLGMTN
jgi:hypothetical protein